MTVLERLRQLEAAATPGKWTVVRYEGHDDLADIMHAHGWLRAECTNVDIAELIAAARNLLPLLLDLAEAAGEVIQDGTSRTALARLAAAYAALDQKTA